jgi:hypothetical protein
MTDLNEIKTFLEQTAKNGEKAVELQVNFFQNMARAQGEAFAALADGRVNSLKEMADAGTLEQAFETNTSYEAEAKETIENLVSENSAAFQELSESLKDLYAPK